MYYITHPSKQQVRAYMRRRETAQRPPPPPDEIRRELGWSQVHTGSSSSAMQGCLFSADMARLGALMSMQWILFVNGFHSIK